MAHELLALGRDLVEAVVLHVVDVEGALAGGLLDAHRRASSGAVQFHGADLARDNSADLGARAESLASAADLPVGTLGLQSTISGKILYKTAAKDPQYNRTVRPKLVNTRNKYRMCQHTSTDSCEPPRRLLFVFAILPRKCTCGNDQNAALKMNQT